MAVVFVGETFACCSPALVTISAFISNYGLVVVVVVVVVVHLVVDGVGLLRCWLWIVSVFMGEGQVTGDFGSGSSVVFLAQVRFC